MRKAKCIYIDEEVYNNILYRNKEFHFNFSRWVEKKYRTEFMDIEDKKRQLNNLQKKQREIESEIAEMEKEKSSLDKQYTEKEKQFLSKVKYMLDYGSTIEGLKGRFNEEFGRDLSLEEFNKIWEVINNEYTPKCTQKQKSES